MLGIFLMPFGVGLMAIRFGLGLARLPLRIAARLRRCYLRPCRAAHLVHEEMIGDSRDRLPVALFQQQVRNNLDRFGRVIRER